MEITLNTIERLKKFVNIALNFNNGKIIVRQGIYTVDGTSMLGLLSLNLLEPIEVYYYSVNSEIMSDFFKKVKEEFT